MRKLLLGAATVITSLGLSAGVAAAQTGGGTISYTGPNSSAAIKTKVHMHTRVTNTNNLSVSNSSSQTAKTGEAEVEHNTYGGDATSGDAKNKNSFKLSATVDNNTAGTLAAAAVMPSGGVGGGTISDTGPDSSAKISTNVSSSTKVNNTNTLTVTNSNTQTAKSGDAEVSYNTHGGSATSGDATNTNNTSITLSVSN